MSKKKKAKAKIAKWRKMVLAHRSGTIELSPPKACKTKCCKKYKKGENKRCSKCPCYDLMKKVA